MQRQSICCVTTCLHMRIEEFAGAYNSQHKSRSFADKNNVPQCKIDTTNALTYANTRKLKGLLMLTFRRRIQCSAMQRQSIIYVNICLHMRTKKFLGAYNSQHTSRNFADKSIAPQCNVNTTNKC